MINFLKRVTFIFSKLDPTKCKHTYEHTLREIGRYKIT